MSMDGERKYWLDNPRNVDRVFWLLCAVCALLVVIDLLLHRHVHFGWEGNAGIYGAIGFVAFYLIVLSGKYLRKVLKRDEDYYERGWNPDD